jgi:hypothetical protein
VKNAKFRQTLVDIVKEAGLSDGCSKSQGNLLYYVASKVNSRARMQDKYLLLPTDHTSTRLLTPLTLLSQYPANSLVHRPVLLKYIVDEKIKVCTFMSISASHDHASSLDPRIQLMPPRTRMPMHACPCAHAEQPSAGWRLRVPEEGRGHGAGREGSGGEQRRGRRGEHLRTCCPALLAAQQRIVQAGKHGCCVGRSRMHLLLACELGVWPAARPA